VPKVFTPGHEFLATLATLFLQHYQGLSEGVGLKQGNTARADAFLKIRRIAVACTRFNTWSLRAGGASAFAAAEPVERIDARAVVLSGFFQEPS
jgi:hypothetical protein